VVDADVVGDPALGYGKDGSADDGHDHDTGTVSGEGSEFGDAQGEDAGEHNRVEEADEDDAVHGDVAAGEHRGGDQSGGADGAEAEQASGFDFLQKRGADEASDHGSSPIEGDEAGRNLFREAADFRLAEIIHQKAANGNLGPDVDEDGDGAEDQVGMIPDGVVDPLTELVLRVWDLRELETADGDGEQDEGDAESDVGAFYGCGFVQAIGV